jgi:transposase-like protein
MITIICRRCGSDNIRKNGLTKTGRQQIHCKSCNFYSTIDLKTSEREFRLRIARNLLSERLSQRAVARTLRMSRTTILNNLKKR